MKHDRKSPKLYLNDIRESIELIEIYTIDKTIEDFSSDIGLQDKVIRRMEIIGEAAKYIPEELRASTPEIPWVLITDMRNVLTHEYFGINLSRIWEVVTGSKLQTLKVSVERLLKDFK
jgi:uncharacterized protein with HEPN domain